MRSVEDLIDCQEDSEELFHYQLGNEKRSSEDLKDCQEGNESVSNYQEGREEKLRLSESLMDSMESSIQQELLMKMGLLYLIICQGSGGSIPYFQVGRDKQEKLNQPGELTEQVSSKVNVD